jgi:hypothetical protein
VSSRRVVIVLIVVIGLLGGGAAFLLGRASDRDKVLDACHAAISKAPGGDAARYDEQVATPGVGTFVVTGAVGASPGTAKQWTCQASVKNGTVTIESAEIRQ